MNEEPFEIEARGAAEGINPIFGEWRHQCDFEPVPYSVGSQRRQAFRDQVRAQLGTRFVYTNQVRVEITLYFDEQRRLETPELGDIDNFAKSILDALKGEGGVLIDDCQVQTLIISWIDVPEAAHFDIELRGSPDDFLPVPLKLYEMGDGLWYPQSQYVWTQKGIQELDMLSFFFGLLALNQMTRTVRSLRHWLRQAGTERFRAFQYTRYLSPTLMGFHSTRVATSGYTMVRRHDWQRDYVRWKESAAPEQQRVAEEMERRWKHS